MPASITSMPSILMLPFTFTLESAPPVFASSCAATIFSVKSLLSEMSLETASLEMVMSPSYAPDSTSIVIDSDRFVRLPSAASIAFWIAFFTTGSFSSSAASPLSSSAPPSPVSPSSPFSSSPDASPSASVSGLLSNVFFSSRISVPVTSRCSVIVASPGFTSADTSGSSSVSPSGSGSSPTSSAAVSPSPAGCGSPGARSGSAAGASAAPGARSGAASFPAESESDSRSVSELSGASDLFFSKTGAAAGAPS